MKSVCRALLALALLLPALAASAAVEVGEPWARATPPSARAGAAYLVLTNRGAEADRLMAAETPVAERAELHTHFMEKGVARMERIDAVALPPGETVALAPGGLHVMLIGLKAPLQPGATFPLTLVFERGGRQVVSVAVRAPRDGPPPAGAHHRH